MDLFQIKSTDKELKRFGLILGSAWGLLGIIHLLRNHPGHAKVFIPLGLFFLAGALLKPEILRPVHFLMAALFKTIMWLTTTIVLICCFYLVFFPLGLLMRLLGKDLLSRSLDRTDDNRTYWIKRDQMIFPRDHYKKQF